MSSGNFTSEATIGGYDWPGFSGSYALSGRDLVSSSGMGE